MSWKMISATTLLIGLSACTPQDKQQVHEDLHKSGEAVKKELKNDAAFVKEEALKARESTQKGVKKLKKDMASDSKSDRKPDADQ